MSADTYLALLTSAHREQPRFVATVQAGVAPLAALQSTMRGLPAAFDLDAAIGVQLDVCGQWIGFSRKIKVPLTGIYFAWGTAGVGWSDGVWKGEFDPADGLTNLPDDLYRLLLKLRVAMNRWDGSVPSVYAAWQEVFGVSLVLAIQDFGVMTIIVSLSGAEVSAMLRALLVNGYVPLKPVGVRIAYYAVPPAAGPLFAWGMPASDGFAGWGTGQWGDHLVPV